MIDPQSTIRRKVLQTALALPVGAAMLPAGALDFIRKENAKPGADWQLTNVKLDGRNAFSDAADQRVLLASEHWSRADHADHGQYEPAGKI